AGPDQSELFIQIYLGKVRPSRTPRRGPSTGSDHCSSSGRRRKRATDAAEAEALADQAAVLSAEVRVELEELLPPQDQT
ncbi:hypothetical protein, partial [Nostocoides australiense]